MKKILFIIALFAIDLTLHAAPVSAGKAAAVAQSFLRQTLQVKQSVRLELRTWDYDAVHLFTLPQGGWVMVAADDCARPILAYSLSGTLRPDALPVAVRNIVSVYQQEIALARSAKDVRCHKEWDVLDGGLPLQSAEEEEVGPLLTTQWFQKSPYNQLCPGHTMTGCVATAMAQVMKYWNYPAFGRGSHSYTDDSGYGTQSADFDGKLHCRRKDGRGHTHVPLRCKRQHALFHRLQWHNPCQMCNRSARLFPL